MALDLLVFSRMLIYFNGRFWCQKKFRCALLLAANHCPSNVTASTFPAIHHCQPHHCHHPPSVKGQKAILFCIVLCSASRKFLPIHFCHRVKPLYLYATAFSIIERKAPFIDTPPPFIIHYVFPHFLSVVDCCIKSYIHLFYSIYLYATAFLID